MPGSRWSPESSTPRAGDHRQTWPSEWPGVCTTSQASPPIPGCSPPRSRVRGLHHRVQVGQPAGEVVGEVDALGLGDPVVGVGVAAPGAGGVGMAVLLAVQVGHRVHRQLGAGHLHEPPGEAVVVDVRVGDHDRGRRRRARSRRPPARRRARPGRRRGGRAATPRSRRRSRGRRRPGRSSSTLSTALTPIGRTTREPPARSSPLLSRACAPAARTRPAARRGTPPWRRPPAGDPDDLEGGDALERHAGRGRAPRSRRPGWWSPVPMSSSAFWTVTATSSRRPAARGAASRSPEQRDDSWRAGFGAPPEQYPLFASTPSLFRMDPAAIAPHRRQCARRPFPAHSRGRRSRNRRANPRGRRRAGVVSRRTPAPRRRTGCGGPARSAARTGTARA